ncbi:MAG: hypothetical protein HPM95_12355 [Alphaproteobacteria bacterium]|nr:hypothetical protein [Alphaproteobacteria bacterium]
MGQVLLVEDTPFFERVIKRQLTVSAGLDVISVPTRADAERVIADPAITLDVALVDLTLPDAPDGEIVDVTMAARLPTIVFPAGSTSGCATRCSQRAWSTIS